MKHVRFSLVLFAIGCAWLFPAYTQTKEATPQVMVAVAPAYPPVAVSANLSDDAIIEVEIDEHGAVTSAHVVSGHKLLQLYSEQAAKRWRFNETSSDLSPRRTRITFAFRIVPKNTSAIMLTPVFSFPARVEVYHTPPVDIPLPQKHGRSAK